MQSLGVSVTFLESFIRESLTVIRPKTEEGSQPVLSEAASMNEPRDQGVKEPVHMNMFELIEKVVKPQTATKQSRFVELHHGKVDPGGKPYVKEANIFVSYPWSADVIEVMQCLLDFAARNPLGAGKECYFWMDCFVINQHSVKTNMSPDSLEDYMDKTIRGCGHMVQVLTKWTSPVAFKRLWCVFECFIAEKCAIPVFFVQPQEEEKLLIRCLLEKGIGSSNPIANQYFKVDSRKAAATLADDKKVLEDAIEMYIGYGKLNEVIKQQLRNYLTDTLKRTIADEKEINEDPVQLAHHGSLILSLGISDTTYLIDLFQKCLKMFEEMGKDQWNPDTVMCYTNLGSVCREGNLTDEALQYLFQALELEQKRIVVERRKVSTVLADIYYQIGGTYIQKGKYREALDVLLNANEIYEQLDEEPEQTMKTQRKVAAIYNKMGLYQVAKKVFSDIIEFASDQNSIPVALARLEMADVLVNEGSHYFGALEVTKAIEVLVEFLGNESTLVVEAYNKRGEIYRQQGKLEQARADQLKALDALQHIYGKDHPKTGRTLGYLASIKNSMGDFEGSLDGFFTALDVLKGFSTEDMSEEIAKVNCSLAGVYLKMNKHDNALECLTTALSIRSKLVGEEHPDVSPIFFDIAKCHIGMFERKEAITFCGKCLEIELRSLGDKHPQIGTSFCLLGDLYKEHKKYIPAYEAYNNAYQIWSHTLKPNHPHLAKLKSTIDETLVLVNAKERRRQELMEAAKPSMRSQIKMSGMLKPTAHSVYYAVAKLYDGHEHSKEAVAMYRRFLKSVQYALPTEHPRVVTAKNRIRDINQPDLQQESVMQKPRFYNEPQ
ncbi:uncharacterized protein LOC134847623 [Symsagittifera roscoffensis]|uniref:uncharacterized protein LOC134847623 n=1 Tax=Symsagittifera roscoffensis TaxID=84072 RepID=UPI00307CA8C8